MESMIERVAGAIYEANSDGGLWVDQSGSFRGRHLRAARAAIEAMREPTARMIEAMDEHAGTIAPQYAYEAAIDAALSE